MTVLIRFGCRAQYPACENFDICKRVCVNYIRRYIVWGITNSVLKQFRSFGSRLFGSSHNCEWGRNFSASSNRLCDNLYHIHRFLKAECTDYQFTWLQKSGFKFLAPKMILLKLGRDGAHNDDVSWNTPGKVVRDDE